MRLGRIKEDSRNLANVRSHQPAFFKLLVLVSQFKKLRIPWTFARTFRNKLSSTVILTVPTGITKEVALVKKKDELWFCDGWQEFVEYFSIGLKYFLMFKYEGRSIFRVHIFDLTACEISYQCNARYTCQVLCEPFCHKGIDNDTVNETQEVLRAPSNNSKKSEFEVRQLDSENHSVSDDEEVPNAKKCTTFVQSRWLRKREGLMTIVTAAGISLPENPSFAADMKPYNLYTGMFLNVPMAFGQGHFRCEVNQSKRIKLEAYDGRQWKVSCVRDKTKYTFRQGWGIFARQIGLQVGDVCVFELTDVKKYVVKVHVVKSS